VKDANLMTRDKLQVERVRGGDEGRWEWGAMFED
jgi:hypothetical protein